MIHEKISNIVDVFSQQQFLFHFFAFDCNYATSLVAANALTKLSDAILSLVLLESYDSKTL
jgi:hypothetical protein